MGPLRKFTSPQALLYFGATPGILFYFACSTVPCPRFHCREPRGARTLPIRGAPRVIGISSLHGAKSGNPRL